MKFVAELKAEGDADKMLKCFEPEIRKGDRSGFSVKKEEGYLIFDVEAKDSTALRATLNSITKLLTVYEKLENTR